MRCYVKMWTNIDAHRVKKLKGITVEDIEKERKMKENKRKWMMEFMRGD
jgi:hypothetical protein